MNVYGKSLRPNGNFYGTYDYDVFNFMSAFAEVFSCTRSVRVKLIQWWSTFNASTKRTWTPGGTKFQTSATWGLDVDVEVFETWSFSGSPVVSQSSCFSPCGWGTSKSKGL